MTDKANIPNEPRPQEGDGCEAMIYSAHLPNLCVAFIIPNGGLPLAGGIFHIRRVRTATAEDRAAFKMPPKDRCPLCDQEESDD